MKRAARRYVVLPVVVVIECVVVISAPFTIGVSLLLTLVTRSTRPVRSTALVIAFAWIELSILIRIQAGVEDWEALLCRLLETGYRAMRRVLAVNVSLEDGSPSPADLERSSGVIVLARHCGPGDTVFIAWLLASYYRLNLRIVLKEALRWEPTINLAAGHLPLYFVRPGSSRARDGISTLAEDLKTGDCLLLFPEGANFTWARWQAAIERLSAAGDYARARLARGQDHTLPPRPGGAIAALEAAPNADVMLLAHSGLSDDGRDRPWWRVPVHQHLTIRTILIPASKVPRTTEAARAFLDRAWSQVDIWVEGHADLVEFGGSVGTEILPG